MIYWDLFIGFLKVGCFSFGGAYGAIPLIREIVLSYGWLNDEALSYMIAISESTPGPIMVNMATYIGSSQAGLAGAALATTAVVLPSFVIILLITAMLRAVIRHPTVQAILQGLKPCIIGIILATGVHLILTNSFPAYRIDGKALGITAVLALVLYVSPMLTRKKPSPIFLILLSALLGAVLYG